jgi:hypothetical protein
MSTTESGWRAVYTRPCEWQVNAALRSLGVDTVMLWAAVTVRHARRVEIKRRPLLTRYIVAELAGHGLLGVPGVVGLVRAGEQPLEIPAGVAEELRSRGNADGMVGGPPAPENSSGPLLFPCQRMQVIGGPLENLLAVIAFACDGPRECLALVADNSLSGIRVARELDRIAGFRGYPA